MTYSIVPFTETLADEYFQFARHSFGQGAYQANPDYLHWLYSSSPFTQGVGVDLRLAVDAAGRVIGCIHCMRMPWRWQGETLCVPSLHNTMVATGHRKGIGGLLLGQAFRGELHAFAPGAPEAVATGLLRVGFIRTDTAWHMRWLRPVEAGMHIALSRVFRKTGLITSDWMQFLMTDFEDAEGVWRCWRPNSVAEVTGIVAFANACWPDESAFTQYWTPELFLWRFFHPHGPKHSLLTVSCNGQCAGYAVFSIGWRHGVKVARLVEIRTVEKRKFCGLLSYGARIMRGAGAHLLLAFTGDAQHNAWLRAIGWRSWRRAPQTLIYHRNRANAPTAYRFMPSVGDYGFESFTTPQQSRE